MARLNKKLESKVINRSIACRQRVVFLLPISSLIARFCWQLRYCNLITPVLVIVSIYFSFVYLIDTRDLWDYGGSQAFLWLWHGSLLWVVCETSWTLNVSWEIFTSDAYQVMGTWGNISETFSALDSNFMTYFSFTEL